MLPHSGHLSGAIIAAVVRALVRPNSGVTVDVVLTRALLRKALTAVRAFERPQAHMSSLDVT